MKVIIHIYSLTIDKVESGDMEESLENIMTSLTEVSRNSKFVNISTGIDLTIGHDVIIRTMCKMLNCKNS